MSSTSRFTNYLYCWICISYILPEKLNEILPESDWSLFQFETYNYSISLALNCFCLLYHSLLFPVTLCHLLALIVPLVVIRFTDCCNSFLVIAIRCHSLYHSLSLVVARCTSRLVFSIFFVCLFVCFVFLTKRSMKYFFHFVFRIIVLKMRDLCSRLFFC